MSRVLANILGAAEPAFRQQIDRLEHAAGMPGADIRLMMEIINETRAKIRDLGLDPHDTTGPELYGALKIRLNEDEQRVREAYGLRPESTTADVLQAVKRHLDDVSLATHTFALKTSVARALLKKLQPKTTMKKLGYRSLDSMLKHEPAAQTLAAASLIEPAEWQKKRLEAYKKFKAGDFEVRRASFFVPTAKHWPEITAQVTSSYKHHMIVVPELGSVVLLPLERDMPGLAITTLLLAVNSVNDMRSLGSYLKLQQVRPDYGKVFAEAMRQEPLAAADLGGEPLPWKAVQWFYGRGHSAYYPDAFEPHVQPDDLSWHDAENVLAQLHSALEFWQGSQLLSLLDGTHPVSLNMLDVALSVCNGLDYSQRIVQHMRTSLNRELLARYLHQENLQALLMGKLDEQLAPDLAFGD